MQECEEREEEQEVPASPRRRARAAALQVLYAVDTSRCSPEVALDWVGEELGLPPRARAFAARLVGGVLEQLEGLDDALRVYAPVFPVHQLSPVDRNLLRLAIFEVTLSKETPPKAVINEAVELAKLFGSESSPRFINGVLGSLMEAMAPQPKESEG